MSKEYQIILADIPLNIQLKNDEISVDLWRWLLRQGHPMYRENVPLQDHIPPITDEDIASERAYFESTYLDNDVELTGPALEFEMLLNRLSDALLKYDAFIFHGAAFQWRGKAYIFTAPSGTGKTTQYRRWREVYGDEIRILNGDKPVLRFLQEEPDGTVRVYPSPWHGKEGYARGFSKLPLGGIIYLEQGSENRIWKMAPEEAGIPLFTQLLFSAADAPSVQKGASLIDRLANSVPVWKLVNLGDHASAKLTHDTILTYEESQKSDHGRKSE
ncbi:MAG: hypothetical protein IKD85_06085 [Firmicutes bacterium]|nr:hypothetical protein [Bacillota bacterium]